jgi:hypothetical protein
MVNVPVWCIGLKWSPRRRPIASFRKAEQQTETRDLTFRPDISLSTLEPNLRLHIGGPGREGEAIRGYLSLSGHRRHHPKDVGI